MSRSLELILLTYSPVPIYAPPPVAIAPHPRPPIASLAMMLVAGILAVLTLILPMAGFSFLGLSFGISLWGISFLGGSVTWWSGDIPALQVGLLTVAVIMVILGLTFAFVSLGVMFGRRSYGRMMAVLTGLFSVLGIVFFWLGLLSGPLNAGELRSIFDTGLYPHAGTFTLIVAGVLSFIGAGLYKPSSWAGPMPQPVAPVLPQYVAPAPPAYPYQYMAPPGPSYQDPYQAQQYQAPPAPSAQAPYPAQQYQAPPAPSAQNPYPAQQYQGPPQYPGWPPQP